MNTITKSERLWGKSEKWGKGQKVNKGKRHRQRASGANRVSIDSDLPASSSPTPLYAPFEKRAAFCVCALSLFAREDSGLRDWLMLLLLTTSGAYFSRFGKEGPHRGVWLLDKRAPFRGRGRVLASR